MTRFHFSKMSKVAKTTTAATKRKVTKTSDAKTTGKNKKGKSIKTSDDQSCVVVEEEAASNVPSADASVVAVATLNHIHNETTDVLIEVRLIDKREIRNITTGNGRLAKVFGLTLEDAAGDTITLTCWGDQTTPDDWCSQLHEFLATGNCYQMSHFQLKPSTTWDKKFSPHAFNINAKAPNDDGVGGLYIAAVSSISTQAEFKNKASKMQLVENIIVLPKLFNDSDATTHEQKGDMFTFHANVNVVGVLITFEPTKTIMCRNGKETTLTKIVIADDSNHCCGSALWGERGNLDFRKGQVLLYNGGSISYNTTGKNYDLCNGRITLLDSIELHPNARVAQIQRWARCAELDIAKYTNISKYNAQGTNAFASGGVASAITNRVSCAQLQLWRTEAKAMIDSAKAEHLIAPDSYTSAAIPQEIQDALPKGVFSILGEIYQTICSTASQTQQQQRSALQVHNNQTLIYPCCPSAVHGGFKKKVEFQSQQNQWYCSHEKCKKHFDVCTYGVKPIFKVMDKTGVIECTAFTLEGLVPKEIANPESLLLACKNLRFSAPGAPPEFTEVSQLLNAEHIGLNDLALLSIDEWISKDSKELAFTIQIKPDINDGISITVSSVRLPNYEQEIILLTEELEQSVEEE
jgi:hypothetical protein